MNRADSFSNVPGQPGRRHSPGDIEAAAADWLALRAARPLTATEQTAYETWLAADPRCWSAVAELEATWQNLDQLAHYPRPAGAAADPDFFARPRSVRRWRLALPALATAAAAVAVIFWLKPWAASPVSTPPTAVAQTPSPFLHLSDGSEVELNAGAQVVEHFTATERRVQLVRGEAHFTVTKNPAWPFIVEAGGVAVQAVGTAFDVRLAPAAVEVLVTEGKVRVGAHPAIAASAADTDAFLVAGQRTVVSNSGATGAPAAPAVETLDVAAIDRALAWQTSRLVFDSTPLAVAVARINRHTEGQPGALHLRIGDSELGAMRISGHIRADHIESFVELLETGFGVTAERLPSGETLLRRAP